MSWIWIDILIHRFLALLDTYCYRGIVFRLYIELLTTVFKQGAVRTSIFIASIHWEHNHSFNPALKRNNDNDSRIEAARKILFC